LKFPIAAVVPKSFRCRRN